MSVGCARLSCLVLLSLFALSGCSNLSVAISPKVTPADLRKVKKVALHLESGGEKYYGMRVVATAAHDSFSDHLAVELLNLGIDVVERSQLDKVMKEQAMNMGGVTETTEKTIAAGKILAVDALITGAVTMSQKDVESATIRMIDIEKGTWMMIITMTSGNDSIQDTAKSFARALKRKLESS